ncbi:unnamed protein product, partial [marine sediment metagenome]
MPGGAKFCPECGHTSAGASTSSTRNAVAPPPNTSSSAATSTPLPEPGTHFASGRYRIDRPLGEGAKKRVYLARDTLIDREV